MTELTSARFSEWASFYVLVGSAGAALIGMQFVVVTLITSARTHPTEESLGAFATPTVVHLAGALVVSAIMSAPWQSAFPAIVALVTCGVGGIGYGAVVISRTFRQTFYKPVWQDWLWYGLLPCGAYSVLAVAAACLRTSPSFASFGIGVAALALLLIGIHNAWDTVTHLVVQSTSSAAEKGSLPKKD